MLSEVLFGHSMSLYFWILISVSLFKSTKISLAPFVSASMASWLLNRSSPKGSQLMLISVETGCTLFDILLVTIFLDDIVVPFSIALFFSGNFIFTWAKIEDADIDVHFGSYFLLPVLSCIWRMRSFSAPLNSRSNLQLLHLLVKTNSKLPFTTKDWYVLMYEIKLWKWYFIL